MEALLCALEGLLPQLQRDPMPILDAIFQFLAAKSSLFSDKAAVDNISALARRYTPQTKDRRLFRLFMSSSSGSKEEEMSQQSNGYALISVLNCVPGTSSDIKLPANKILHGKEIYFLPADFASGHLSSLSVPWPVPLDRQLKGDEPSFQPVLVFLSPKEHVFLHMVQQGVVLGKSQLTLERGDGAFKPLLSWIRSNLTNSQAIEILIRIYIRFDGESNSSTSVLTPTKNGVDSSPFRSNSARGRDRYGFPIPKIGAKIDISQVRRAAAQLDRNAMESLFNMGGIRGCTLANLKTLACETGFPSAHRAALWREALIQRCTYIQASRSPSSASREPREAYSCGGLTHTEIQLDVGRTLPFHPFFSDAEGLSSLRRVLLTTCSDAGVTYCQSMNYIAALLLLLTDEHSAAWMLGCIVTQILPDYFGFNILGVQVDINVLEVLLDEYIPSLRLHFLRLNYPVSIFASQWLMCLFVGVIPTDTLLRVWDFFFTHGRDVLVATALAILRTHQASLESLCEIDSLHEGMRLAVSNTYDASIIIEDAKRTLATKRISILRGKFEEAVERRTRNAQVSYLLECTEFTQQELMTLHTLFASESMMFQTKKGVVIRGDNDKVANALSLVHEVALSRTQFSQLLHSISPHHFGSEMWQQLLFTAFDMNADGTVDFNEVCSGLSVYIHGDDEQLFRLLFASVDIDTDGFIKKDEFMRIVSIIEFSEKGLESEPARMEELQQMFCAAQNAQEMLPVENFLQLCSSMDSVISMMHERACAARNALEDLVRRTAAASDKASLLPLSSSSSSSSQSFHTPQSQNPLQNQQTPPNQSQNPLQNQQTPPNQFQNLLQNEQTPQNSPNLLPNQSQNEPTQTNPLQTPPKLSTSGNLPSASSGALIADIPSKLGWRAPRRGYRSNAPIIRSPPKVVLEGSNVLLGSEDENIVVIPAPDRDVDEDDKSEESEILRRGNLRNASLTSEDSLNLRKEEIEGRERENNMNMNNNNNDDDIDSSSYSSSSDSVNSSNETALK